MLLNDWSARDIQRWEYRPLGPFLGKSFATSISQWVVPWRSWSASASRSSRRTRSHSRTCARRRWAYDIPLEIELNGTVNARSTRGTCTVIARQAGHEVEGASLESVTCSARHDSGPERDQRGSLQELSWAGRNRSSSTTTTRAFLEDGDEVVLRGEPLGEVRGTAVRSDLS